MKVKNLDIVNALGKRIRIVKAKDKALEGRKGELTMPFGHFKIGQVGVFLDKPIDKCRDIYNLDRADDIEFIEEQF